MNDNDNRTHNLDPAAVGAEVLPPPGPYVDPHEGDPMPTLEQLRALVDRWSRRDFAGPHCAAELEELLDTGNVSAGQRRPTVLPIRAQPDVITGNALPPLQLAAAGANAEVTSRVHDVLSQVELCMEAPTLLDLWGRLTAVNLATDVALHAVDAQMGVSS